MSAILKTAIKVGCIGAMSMAWVHAGTVDVNLASVQALESVKGIGAVTAQRIVAERARGPYESLEHLSERLSGIGPKRIQKLKSAGLCAGTAQASCAPPLTELERPSKARVSARTPAGEQGVTPAVIQLP
jgi:competence protein ComEA